MPMPATQSAACLGKATLRIDRLLCHLFVAALYSEVAVNIPARASATRLP